MFGIGFTEIFLILAVALIVVGPSRLPDFARTAGKGIRTFQDALNGIRRDVMQGGNDPTEPQAPPEPEQHLTERGPAYYQNLASTAPPPETEKGKTEHADKTDHPLS